jgi:GNAT superfamily N-acetyltransferase
MTIRQAVIEDLGQVQEIVCEVVREMGASGNPQWNAAYPDEARFRRDIENGALYVAEENRVVLGFAVMDHDEPEGYRALPWSASPDAVILHRLAVAQQSRSLGVASRLEAFLCDLAQTQGIRHIKVDTHSTNTGMQAFLTRKGYRKVGETEFPGRPLSFFCYEKLLPLT